MEISEGIVKKPILMLVYGIDGIGKSTFAAGAPKSIFVGPESGSNHLKTRRAKNIKTWEDVNTALDWLLVNQHDNESLVLDSIDWIEMALFDFICRSNVDPKTRVADPVTSIDEACGAYGKAYTYAISLWRAMQDKLTRLREEKKMNIIVVGHHQQKKFEDPINVISYERYSLKLNEKAAAVWREFMDVVAFFAHDDVVFKVTKDAKTGKVKSSGAHKMYFERNGAYDAKNRLGLPASLLIPKDGGWKSFFDACEKGQPDSLENLIKDLDDLKADFEAKKKAEILERFAPAYEKAKAASDITALIDIRNFARDLNDE